MALLGLTLKYLRLKTHISLRQLAQEVGKSHTYLARVESGDLEASDDILKKLSSLYNLALHREPAEASAWFETVESVHQLLLNAHGDALMTLKEKLTLQASDYKGSRLYGEYALLMWAIDVFTDAGIKESSMMDDYLAQALWNEVSHPLNFVLLMALSKYYFHLWKMSDALIWLEKANELTQHPHDKAWIKLSQANIESHRFARQTALDHFQNARQTFGFFNTYKRMAEVDIKLDLYHRRQIHRDTVDYPPLKAKAKTFLLNDVLSEIQMIEGLRAQHLGHFDQAVELLHGLDLTHPQHYFNASMVLYLAGDHEGLKTMLEARPNHYVMPVVFEYGLEFLLATLDEDPSFSEKALKKYLKEGLKHRLYGETRRAQYELAKIYEKTRRYKDAVAVMESITQTILKA